MDAGDERGGGELLMRISNDVVQAQKRYFGKGPVQARSYMFDDLLFVVMREGMTVAEQTMLDFGMPDLVRQFRQEFQNKMNDELTGLIEALTGRKVINYQSQVLFDPNMIIEMFVFSDMVSDNAHGTAHLTHPADEPAGTAPN